MTKRKATRAEQLRRHRLIFEYALAHGLTLIAAEAALAREEWEATQARLAAVKRCGRPIDDRLSAASGLPNRARPAPEDAPWMMRD